MKRRAVALGGALVLAWLRATPTLAAHAQDDASRERFAAAVDLMATGRHADAAAALVALADEMPGSAEADDALFEAAKLYEEQIGDALLALRLYERLLTEHADSRVARAAGLRARDLRALIGPDDSGVAAFARYRDIVRGAGERTPDESIARMAALVRDHATWAGAPQAVLWLAGAHERVGDDQAAIDRFLEAAERWPGTRHAFDGYLGAGRIAVSHGRFDDAARWYAAMPIDDDVGRLRARADARANLARAQWRAQIYLGAFAVVAGALLVLVASLRTGAGSWRAAGGALRTPPLEAVYFVPVGVVLLCAALTSHGEIAPACAIILSGGLAFTWLSGAGLAAARTAGVLSRTRVVAHAMSTVAATIAFCYIALHRTRLVDLIVETVQFGPER
jgi:hypothetical protein